MHLVSAQSEALNTLMALKLELAKFLSTFVAAHPPMTAHCKAIINGTATPYSQMAQDLVVWRSLFLQETLQGSKGFYVDSGANHPRDGSNTWFFDRCLGWNGICVEPNPSYSADLRRERTCTVLEECISDRNNSVLKLSRLGPLSKIGGKTRPVKVACNTLGDMLARVGSPGVDFWSLDVEVRTHNTYRYTHEPSACCSELQSIIMCVCASACADQYYAMVMLLFRSYRVSSCVRLLQLVLHSTHAMLTCAAHSSR
jgi:hypothetical protein